MLEGQSEPTFFTRCNLSGLELGNLQKSNLCREEVWYKFLKGSIYMVCLICQLLYRTFTLVSGDTGLLIERIAPVSIRVLADWQIGLGYLAISRRVWSTFSSHCALSSNHKSLQHQDKFSGKPRFDPGAAGWEARMLPLCHAAKQSCRDLRLWRAEVVLTWSSFFPSRRFPSFRGRTATRWPTSSSTCRRSLTTLPSTRWMPTTSQW